MYCIVYSSWYKKCVVKSGICGVSDENSKCAVTSAPIRGQTVTLSCIVTYRWQTGRVRPGATLSASISWESAAATFLNKSSTRVSNSGGTTIGETLQVDMTTLASGNEIPSYNYTTSFHFTGNQEDLVYIYAHNSVSWSCVSDPVVTWCRYF